VFARLSNEFVVDVSLTIITKPVVVFVIKIKQAIGLREQQRGEVCRKNAKGLRLNNRLFSPFLLLLFYLPCLLYDYDVVWDRMIFCLAMSLSVEIKNNKRKSAF